MKIVILVCSLATFGTCLTQEKNLQDPLEEARNRANEFVETFTKNYGDIIKSPAYNDLVTKSKNILTSLKTKNEEANQQIKTAYDEFYTTLSPGNETGFTNECYNFTTLQLTVDDVQNRSVNSYEMKDLRLKSPLSLFSDDYFEITNKFYIVMHNPKITVHVIDTAIAEFENKAAKFVARANQLITEINDELDSMYAKSLSETEERVRNALYLLNSIKDHHEICLLKRNQ